MARARRREVRPRRPKSRTAVELQIKRRLRELFNASGMTLTDAAAAAGISLDAFNRILSGERVPHVNTLVALSKIFHVSLADLLDEKVDLSAPARLAASLINEQSPDVQSGAIQVLRTFFEVVARYRNR